MMNPVVVDNQPKKFPVVNLFGHFRQIHFLDMLANAVKAFGEKSHASHIKQIQRVIAMKNSKNSVVCVNDV